MNSDKAMIYSPGRKTENLAGRIVKANAKKVLDVGCSKGYLGKLTRGKNPAISFFGVDVSLAALQTAEQNGYSNTIQVNLNDEKELEKLNQLENNFEVIVLADVLEHSLFPEKILSILKNKLTSSGIFLISIPNIGFFPLRLKHLFGMWKYESSGIMDDSHVKFYNLDSAKELIEKNGLKVTDFESFPKRLPSWIWPSLLSITFLFECKK